MKIDFSFGKDFDKLWEELMQLPQAAELATLDGTGKQTDMVAFSKNFFSKPATVADVSVDSNANVEDSSIIAYEVEVAKPLFRINAYYLLYKYVKKLHGASMAREVCKKQFTKEIYINDFHKFAVAPYCFNFSCLDVMFQGLPFVKKIKSDPPKHLTSFIGQIIQFVVYASNSVAGAVGLADFFICLSYFYALEGKNRRELKQEIQSFVYSVNQPFRGGHQSAFTNVSLFDSVFLDKLCEEYIFPDGTHPNAKDVEEVQDAFMEVMNETLSQTPCTFPVTTACFAVDDTRNIKDELFLDKICKANMDYGWINFYAGETSTLSSCCRLRSESNHEYFNSFGAGGTKIGSISVTTLNLPRIAYLALEEEKRTGGSATAIFFNKLQDNTIAAAVVNNAKRYVIQKRIDGGNLPLYTLGFMDIKKQYSTCGVCGVNEACEILGYDILTKEGEEFVGKLLEFINSMNAKFEVSFKYPHNCEQTPSENSAIKMAQADKVLGYQDGEYALYSNQFIPLIKSADLYDRAYLQGKFDKLMTGGAILHLNVGEKIADVSVMKQLIKIAVKLGVIYQAINYVMNVCEEGHVSVGSLNLVCPVCGKPIKDKLTRVVGFLTNVKNWHKVRREQDFPSRQFYIVDKGNVKVNED